MANLNLYLNFLLWMAFGLTNLNAFPCHELYKIDNLAPRTSWLDKRWSYVIRQKYNFSCGTAALATIFRYVYNKPILEEDLLAQIDATQPISFATLADCAASYGIKGKGYRMTWDQFCASFREPCIVAFQDTIEGHFAVCYLIDIKKQLLVLGDPSFGIRILSAHTFLKAWQAPKEKWGYALFFQSNEIISPPDLSDFLMNGKKDSLDQNLFPGIMHLLQ